MAKEFDHVILPTIWKERKVDDATLEELKDKYLFRDSVTQEDDNEESKPDERKFYQIETKNHIWRGRRRRGKDTDLCREHA